MYNTPKTSRISIFWISCLFLLLLTSIFHLQIFKGDEYAAISEKNFVRLKTILPMRGEIFDRRYRPIALNKPSFSLYIIPGQIKDRKKVSKFIDDYFRSSQVEIDEIISNSKFRMFQEILLIQNIPYEKVVFLSEHINDFPSLTCKSESIRNYIYNNHFVGYVGRISEDEYENLKKTGYSINSIIGKTGLEKFYESLLVGKSGYDILQVDSSGRNLQFFKHNLHKDPVDGADIILTIDNELQNFINTILPEDKNCAVVVCDTRTGGILAYVSKPEFDPNLFAAGLSMEEWNNLINDPRNPMLDRIIHGTYPPGSTYKPIVATLGLEDSLITPTEKLSECTGGLQIGDRFFKCWHEEGHGRLEIINAIKYSCDVFFYDLSTRIELDRMKEFTCQNRLTVKTGIDLIGERDGFFPDLKWYKESFGKYAGIIGPKVNLAIGQGEILCTPLQLCCYFAAIANDGLWKQPHLMNRTIEETCSKEFIPWEENLPVSEKNIKLLQNALLKAVNERYGTGSAARLNNITIYGKTGSAENHMGEETHAWFAGYAVWEEPEIAFTVFLENAGHGGSVAAPLASRIVFFYDKMKRK